jgi:hypothetical protein
VPKDLAAVCRVARAKDPAGRYPTAAAFAVWGRADGSARVADLTRALARLAALTGR